MKATTTKGPRPKHVPQRTCVACKTTGAKRGLVRVVRLTDGSVEVDESGKKSGRGAYLCRTTECWDKALKSKLLEYIGGKLTHKRSFLIEPHASLFGSHFNAVCEKRIKRLERHRCDGLEFEGNDKNCGFSSTLLLTM